MRSFDEIYGMAAQRKGGPAALEGLLVYPADPKTLAARPESAWLAILTKCVFQAGFNWKVIDAKWDGFVDAFDAFNPDIVSRYVEADVDRLLQDSRIVRNLAKIEATVHNAAFVRDVSTEHGSFGAFFSTWPQSDYAALLDVLASRGARLAGATGQRVLRAGGYPSYVFSPDVVAALVRDGVVRASPSSKKDLVAVQAAFNQWSAYSGRSLTEISQILAYSV